MYKRNIHYALNQKDPDAIVYVDVHGNLIRLTKEDFPTAEEFWAWKEWSDNQYYRWEKDDHIYTNRNVSLDFSICRTAFSPGIDLEKINTFDFQEHKMQDTALLEKVRTILTEKQFRRLWQYEVEKRTEEEIGLMEGVGQRRISSSIAAARKKIKKYFKDSKKQGLKHF